MFCQYFQSERTRVLKCGHVVVRSEPRYDEVCQPGKGSFGFEVGHICETRPLAENRY